jgi:hypothetical protein
VAVVKGTSKIASRTKRFCGRGGRDDLPRFEGSTAHRAAERCRSANGEIMAESCPKCGFSYGWDGICCRHCHFPYPTHEAWLRETSLPKLLSWLPRGLSRSVLLSIGCRICRRVWNTLDADFQRIVCEHECSAEHDALGSETTAPECFKCDEANAGLTEPAEAQAALREAFLRLSNEPPSSEALSRLSRAAACLHAWNQLGSHRLVELCQEGAKVHKYAPRYTYAQLMQLQYGEEHAHCNVLRACVAYPYDR